MQRLAWLVAFGLALTVFASSASAAQDFDYLYRKGKLLFKKKLYFDAVKEFEKAAKTPRGMKHFATHYYLSRTYYWLPNIQKAMLTLEKCKKLIKNKAQKGYHQQILTQIKTLYGKILVVPEVDPEDVGSKLQLVIKPKSEFSNAHKKRYFQVFLSQIKRDGGVLINNRPIYLPKGDYEVALKQPQCLKYGLLQGEELAKEFSVGDSEFQLVLREKRSCNCVGGQKIYKEGQRLYCSCPPGTGWDKKKKRCIVVKQVNPWPWVLTGVGVAVVGGTVVTILALRGDGSTALHLAGPDTKGNGNTLRVWSKKK